MEKPVLIRLAPTGWAINFPEYDEGNGFDLIEQALGHVGFKRRSAWSNPLEEVRQYRNDKWAVFIQWDGYFTDLVLTKGSGRLLDLFIEMERSPAFCTEVSSVS